MNALEWLANLCSHIPKWGEQRAIAAFLDRQTARIDALIERVEKSIDRHRAYCTTMISAVVTGKIASEWNNNE